MTAWNNCVKAKVKTKGTLTKAVKACRIKWKKEKKGKYSQSKTKSRKGKR